MRQLTKRYLSIIMTLFMIVGLFSGVSLHTNAEETGPAPRAVSTVNAVADDTATVLAFTSDVHNRSRVVSSGTSANRLQRWLEIVKDKYNDKLECVAFGGDMADGGDTINAENYWDMTRTDMKVVSDLELESVYTTGNHEYRNGNFDTHTQDTDVVSKFIENAPARDGDDYHMYCLGSSIGRKWDENGSKRLNHMYDDDQVTKLDTYLKGIPDNDDKVIFVITHYPLHYISTRKFNDNAGKIIDVLNEAVDRGKKIVFLWGHNHTEVSKGAEKNYDRIFKPTEMLTINDTNTQKTLKFYYAAAGCMCDTEYTGGGVKGKGIVITIDDAKKLSFTYYDKEGSPIVDSSFTEKDPVAVQSAAITGADGKPLASNPTVGEGSSLQLGYTTVPEDANVNSVTWESLSPTIATVDTTGKVKGVKAGTATIKITISDGINSTPVTATVDITVTPVQTVTYALTSKMEAGKKYLIATGKEGSVYLLSDESGSTLKGVDATVTDGKISIPTTTADHTLFEAEGSNDNSILLKTGAGYLYAASSTNLSMVAKSSISSGKYWHYKEKDDNGKDINLLWFYNGTDGDYGYTGTNAYKYYLTCNNGNFAKDNLDNAETFVNTTKTIPKIYLFTEDDGSGETPEKYTVTFHANNHGTAPAAYTNVESGNTIKEPTAPSAEGWTFGGWYTEASCVNKWNFATDKVTKNVDLYAKWTENTVATYTVTFHANNHGTAPVAYTNVESGSTIKEPAEPSAEGWTFGGWYTEASCVNKWNFATDKVTKNVDLYARWTEKGGEQATVYDVILPSGFEGPETVEEGENYRFTKSADADNYTYGDVTYRMNWGDPIPITPNADGVYTIENVTGDLFIIGSRRPKEEPHEHTYGKPSYTWTKDNSKCTATATCSGCSESTEGHTVTETVDTKYSVVKAATSTAVGTGRYTATFTNTLFTTQTQDVEIPKTTPTPAPTPTPKTNPPAPAADPSKNPAKMGKDGTPFGEGASLAAAEKAILSLPNDNDPAGTQFSKLTLRSPKQTKSSIKLSWTKPGNAKTFIVYGNNCGKTNKPKKLATVSDTSLNIKAIAGKKLAKGKYCKFIVLALDGSNMVVTTSKIIHVTTKGGKVGNDKSISVDKSVIKKAKKMKAGKSLKVKAKAVPQSKNLKVKKHVAVRYESTDTSIATVTKKGKITAKKKGTCNVYAYAQDGAFKKIKVVVK